MAKYNITWPIDLMFNTKQYPNLETTNKSIFGSINEILEKTSANASAISLINTQLANIYTKPEIDTKFISVYGNIDSLNDVVGVLGNDVTNLKAHPILNSPTNEPILVEISENTKLNVNHNLMFDGSGSPDTSPVDPADNTKASYVTLAYFNANSQNLTFNAPLRKIGSSNNVGLDVDSNSLKITSAGLPSLYAFGLSNGAGQYKNYNNLNNLDNTSDLDKPISTATQTALDGKQIRFGTSTGWDSNCFQNSVGGNIYVKALTKAGISSYITYDQINTAITTLPTKQDLLTPSNAGQFINIDVSVPTIPVISVKESQLSNQIIGIDTYDYSAGTSTTFNAIQTVFTELENDYTAINTNTTNIAKGFYWKPRSITGANTRTATVASGSLVSGKTYRVGYNLNTNYSTSAGIVFREFTYNNSGMQLDQLITFTLLVIGNVTTLQTNGITITITSNSGTLGFITSLDIKEPLTS